MTPAAQPSAQARFAERVTQTLDVDGVSVAITTADMDMILAMVGFTAPMQAELQAAPEAVIEAICAGITSEPQRIAVMAWGAGMVSRHGQAIKGIVSVATGQPAEWVGKLLPDRFMCLLLLALKVNADFFSQALPALQALARQVGSALGGVAAGSPDPAA